MKLRGFRSALRTVTLNRTSLRLNYSSYGHRKFRSCSQHGHRLGSINRPRKFSPAQRLSATLPTRDHLTMAATGPNGAEKGDELRLCNRLGESRSPYVSIRYSQTQQTDSDCWIGPSAYGQPCGVADLEPGDFGSGQNPQPSPLPQYRLRSMSLYARTTGGMALQ